MVTDCYLLKCIVLQVASLARLLVPAHPIRVSTDSVGCADIGWTLDPEKPFTGWRTCGQTKHTYTKNL